MQHQTQPETDCLRKEVVFTLDDGRKVIIDMAPLEGFFKEYPYSSIEFAHRLQTIMDNMVLSLPPKGTDFAMELTSDYDLLKHLRDAFRKMTWKEVTNG